MPLTCEVEFYNDADTCFAEPDKDFTQMPKGTEGHCCSCNKKLKPGDTVLRHECWRHSTEEEVDQYYNENLKGGYEEGAQVPLPDEYLCETCGEIRMNLEAAGYVICLYDDMATLLWEYQQMTGFNPAKYEVA